MVFTERMMQKEVATILNSKGMGFKNMCPHLDKYGHCGEPAEANMFDLYRVLARIAGIAAHREIVHLEAGVGV